MSENLKFTLEEVLTSKRLRKRLGLDSDLSMNEFLNSNLDRISNIVRQTLQIELHSTAAPLSEHSSDSEIFYPIEKQQKSKLVAELREAKKAESQVNKLRRIESLKKIKIEQPKDLEQKRDKSKKQSSNESIVEERELDVRKKFFFLN